MDEYTQLFDGNGEEDRLIGAYGYSYQQVKLIDKLLDYQKLCLFCRAIMGADCCNRLYVSCYLYEVRYSNGGVIRSSILPDDLFNTIANIHAECLNRTERDKENCRDYEPSDRRSARYARFQDI